MIAVLPVCRPDFHIALKWLAWARWLRTERPYHLVVFCAASMEAALIKRLQQAVDGWEGAIVEINPQYYERHELGYGACANHMFLKALEFTEMKFPGLPTLWCEPDAIPLRAGWNEEIAEEYSRCGAPFLGDFHAPGAIPHLTGNSVYSPDWRRLAPSIAALPGPVPSQGWDTSCSADTLPQSSRSIRIQQTWIVPMPRFTEEMMPMLHQSSCLFHRNKDGSLIDVLAARMGCPPIPLETPVCGPTPTQPHRQRVYEVIQPRVKRTGGVHILVVSYKRDIELLSYCLRSIEKYCSGFAGATLMVPTAEAKVFRDVPSCVELRTFDEMPGKGFLHHMIQVCRADEICPDADQIVHFDADCMVWRPTTPSDFVKDGKCLMVREDYRLLESRNPNRLIWRTCVERATGIRPTHDIMVRHPNVYPRALYSHLRNVVERHLKMDFNQYVFSCENGWPQGFCEYVSLGAVGLRDFPDAFKVVDYDHEKDSVECGVEGRGHQYIYRPERDAVVEGWSHGGVQRYRNDWDAFMLGKLPHHYVK